jgi:hypothetical protein
MSNRIRVGMGLATLIILIASSTVFAKGGFSFITITGPNLKEEIRSNDPALTEDFFAFADFFRNRTKSPAAPGVGYEITRYYLDGKREIPFDQLHYYPETGFVYYDGIVNGSSEYDGEWYAAKPEIKTIFQSTLATSSIGSTDQTRSSESTASTAEAQSRRSQPLPQLILLVAAVLALILLFAYRLRQAVAH